RGLYPRMPKRVCGAKPLTRIASAMRRSRSFASAFLETAAERRPTPLPQGERCIVTAARLRHTSTDHEHQLAAEMAGLAYFVRGHSFAELKARHFRRADRPDRYQLRDAFEMRPITPDMGTQGHDIAAIRLGRLWARGNERRPAARLQHGE